VDTTHPQHALAEVAAPTAAIYRQVLVLSSVQFHSTLLLLCFTDAELGGNWFRG
jgi:hypothetical protein